MKKRLIQFAALTLMACMGVAQAATLTVTTDAATGPGSLTAAITALNNGDTIAFNIPGAGVHYIQTPPDGYPLITKNNITIDGYSQPSSSANTAGIHSPNNAVLKICLTSTNGNALAMQTACETSFGAPIPRLGYGDDEQAVLGFFHATNATIKGLAILASHDTTASGTPGTCKAICFAANSAENGGGQCQNFHISGCWFGVEPTTRQVAMMPDGVGVATPRIAVASYRTRNAAAPDNTVYNFPGTFGVKAGSTNPRAEFNIFVTGYGFDAEGLQYRFCGNFWNVLPDGMTFADIAGLNSGLQVGDGFIEIGRNASDVLVGTDGDGVNDADEGNVFAGIGLADITGAPAIVDIYSDPRTNFVFAGNYVGVAIDGVTTFSNYCAVVNSLGGQSLGARIGTDFDGVSDALEVNIISVNHPFALIYTDPPSLFPPKLPTSIGLSAGARLSMRGNQMVNNSLTPFNYANGLSSLLTAFTNYCAPYMDVTSVSGLTPVLATTNIFPNLTGTFPVGINGYTTVTLDIYELDSEGWNNGKLFLFPELTDMATYTNGFPQGKRYIGSVTVPNTGDFSITLPAAAGVVTVTANYSSDPVGTHNGKVHTSNFSLPAYVLPGGAASVGLTQIVPDVPCWFDTTLNAVTNGPIILANQPPVATLGNWEPFIGQVGDSTFLIEFNTFANDATLANQNNAVAKQPAAGGAGKVDYCFYGDNGTPFKGALNLSRQNGNPGKVAGDLRYGASKFITEAESSLGQVAEFQVVPRWGNNDIYTGINRYAAEQIFSLNPYTLAQTPVTNAWEYVFGNFVGVMGAGNNAPQVSRTGGRPNFLDNGNIVVMIDDKSQITGAGGEVTTFSIIQPDGTIVKNYTLAKAQDIFDNMCAVKGGFVIRVHNSLLFYDNAGSLTFSNDVNVSSGMNFGGSADVGGRGDGIRIGGDIRSHNVYLAGTIGGGGSAQVGVAAWDVRTGQFAGGSIVTDGDPAVTQCDRTSVAVDALNRVCVVTMYKPDKNAGFGYQAGARVAQFDGANFNWLTHTFFPFLNHDQVPNGTLGYLTLNPVVAMTTREICFAAKGTFNSTNNASAGPDTLNEQTVYTVVSHPSPVVAPRPTVSVTKSGSNLIVSWNADDGLFTVQTRSAVNTGAWANATAGNVLPPVSLPAGAGATFIRLAR